MDGNTVNDGTARAVFLDRDGVINADDHLITDPERLRILPRVPEALVDLSARGFLLIVVTNQAVVARGMATEDRVQQIHRALKRRLFQAAGARLDDVLFCPHHPHADVARYRIDCACRKPWPGMLVTAAQRHGIRLSASYMIGDRDSDMAAGNAAGCHCIRVDSGQPPRVPIVTTAPQMETRAEYRCDGLAAAARWIIGRERQGT